MTAVDPDRYQPPLRWWSQAWRFAVCLLFSAAIWLTVVDGQTGSLAYLFWLDIVLGVLSYLLVFGFRRRWPMTVAVVSNLLAAFSSIASGASVLAVCSLATRRVIWQVATISVVTIASATFFSQFQPVQDPSRTWVDLSLNTVAASAMVGWGFYIGSRRELLWTWRTRAETAEAEQERRASQARLNERARIAREMHDVLAHRISQIAMHAGALSFREDLSAEQMRDHARTIQERAHEALTDLRGVLGVLRDEETGAPMNQPQPTYDDLRALVGQATAAGMRVELEDDVDRTTPVPDALGRTLYRVVQEGITNAHKHAPGALLTVVLSGGPDDGITFRLHNPIGFGRPLAGRPPERAGFGDLDDVPGSGLGLVGIAERVELRGGSFVHQENRDAFVMQGWLPWAA